MTRMSREFSLVLLGAGLLTAGYFLWPEEDYKKRSEEQVRNRVGGGRSHGGILFIGYHGGSSSVRGGAGATGAMGSVSRGGLGSIGGRVSTGG